ncbi:oxaloacetate decarboxylase beta subunit [Natranaerovirga pectinivora]|uniref:Oxaloacetate decarboxylase beta subunit n=1 Tax=Natranaerovirga pectinivora TaxID=682400 RepID=A0A4R3MKB8_9FIRM|nr:sodium ion-translocating decarboxylase subunit beta [Natranaerovirga pectinivora]TCT15007.1 oxaloacetate decarboxylase beta subunit [Natranaerovirga pectinivora]
MDIFKILNQLYLQSAFNILELNNVIMIIVSLILLYLAIKKEYEPLLLIPIAFGMLLVNLFPGIYAPPEGENIGGLLYYLSQGNKLGIFPPLIFVGVGALTDFGPLLANPKSFLLGAAAQFGIFFAFISAVFLGTYIPGLEDITKEVAAAIGIIGGADGPTAIYIATRLAPEFLSPIAVAAYSYMAMVPIIQPPIMKLFTTKEERAIQMEQLRPVSKLEKILFPIIVAILVILVLPETAPLVGMLMFGNLLKESGVVRNLVDTASNALMYIIVIFLGLSVGASALAENFLNTTTLAIIALGLVAFCIGTAAGVLFGKVMCKLSGGKVNPLIGAAGVSAVPMAARIVQKVGRDENPNNFLLMHAMGPNVAGVIGSAVAAGAFLAIFG